MSIVKMKGACDIRDCYILTQGFPFSLHAFPQIRRERTSVPLPWGTPRSAFPTETNHLFRFVNSATILIPVIKFPESSFSLMYCALTIAGSDSSGGAGIQADLKVFATLNVHGFSAITAVTAQRANEVLQVAPTNPELVRAQIASAFQEADLGAVKIGMLAHERIVHAVVEELNARERIPVVVDPILSASDGTSLFADALDSFKQHLLPISDIVTPNLSEAQRLSNLRCENVDQMKEAAATIHSFGVRFVLIKGGHLPSNPTDILFDGKQFLELEGERVEGVSVHGTGCLLSASIAGLLAKGWEIIPAVRQAKRLTKQWIQEAQLLKSGARVAMFRF